MIKKLRFPSVIFVGLLLIAISLMPVIRVRAVAANIVIRSDADFVSCNCVSTGTGTKANPYVLSGLTLTTQTAPGILVDNTKGKITKYFDIVADTITGGSGPPTNYPGVEFVKVNGLGEITGPTNTFNGNKFGIYLVNSHGILIDGVSDSNGATINNNGVDGISIVGGGSNTISNLQVNHNGIGIPESFLGGGVGIRLSSTVGNTVTNVVLSDDAMAGLAMFSSSQNLIEGVSVHYPDFFDAVVDGGSGNTLEQNIFQTGDYVGLWLRDSTNYNLIVGNSLLAIGPTGHEVADGIVPYFASGMYISSGSSHNKIENNLFSKGDPIDQDNGAIINPFSGQLNNVFNDPITGNEPAHPVFPSGPAGSGNTFCGNAISSSQGVPSNPPCP